ncbi:type I TA system toxin YonT [Bacillus paralicheniformis]|uniref:type I TA system toxin YonT n=1 Tax=Bacillus paralicheniformis TaxID=1648923 RepID=UPI003703842F
MFDRVGVVLAIVLSLSTLTINILAIIEKLAAIRNKTSHRQQRKKRIRKRNRARHHRRTRL